MKDTWIVNAEVYTGRSFEPKTILMKDGRIVLCDANEKAAEGCIYDASGLRAVPGFIDIHTHGALGADINTSNADDLSKIAGFFAEHGTTSFLASIMTDSIEQTEKCIRECAAFMKAEKPGAEMLGIHLEGPFLSPEYKGAMPERLLSDGDAELIRHYQEIAEGNIRYITLAPEIKGTREMIPCLKEMGIAVAIGHSGATYDEAMEAINLGAEASTHTCNAMRSIHQHEPGILGAVLESDVYCEVIADGLHLHPGIVRLIIKVKGTDRVIAVTDSIMAAGLADGEYHLGVNKVTVKDGDAKLAADGTRAGSTLAMDKGFRNIMKFTGLYPEEALPLFTSNPARLIGADRRKGSIENGKDADILLIDGGNEIKSVFIRGLQFK